MATTPLPAPRPLTATGESCCVVVPSPSCPVELRPHATTEPFDFKATAWLDDWVDAMAIVPLPAPRPVTGTGVRRWVVVPSPRRPLALLPHARTVPSDFSA